jgi:hypothetical protein
LLNRSEYGYLALDGFAGSFHQAYLLRLDRPVPEPQVRQALRQVVGAFDRLRSLAVPRLRRYAWDVLPDGPLVDQLFDAAYRVRRDVDLDDPRALEAHHMQLLNEPLPLEHGLAVRLGLYPHARRPMVHIGVHHALGDGRTMQMILTAVLAALNGQPPARVPMQAPSMVHAIRPLRWGDWPRKLLASRAHAQAQKRRLAGLAVRQLPTQATPHYSAHAVVHHRLAVDAPQLRAHARALGVSLNTLLVAAFAQTFVASPADACEARVGDIAGHTAGNTAGSRDGAAVIRLSVDLRRYFPPEVPAPQAGNQVAAFLVVEQGAASLAERARSVDAQVRAALARFEQREMCWGYLFEELMPLLGRTAVSRIAWGMKRGGRFPRISAHATSLGDCNGLNAAGATVRVDELHIGVPSLSPLLGMTELGGRFNLDVIFQRSETEPDAVRQWLARLDALLLAEVATQPAAGAPQAALAA